MIRTRLIVYSALGLALCASVTFALQAHDGRAESPIVAAAGEQKPPPGWMTPSIQAALVTLLVAIAGAVGHFAPKKLNRMRWSAGENQRGGLTPEAVDSRLTEYVAAHRDYADAQLRRVDDNFQHLKESTERIERRVEHLDKCIREIRDRIDGLACSK